MNKFSANFEVKWADVDPNMHLRHTVYLDYADQTRIRFFNQHGVTFNKLMKMRIGPVIFSTRSSFLKEVMLNERVSIDCTLLEMSEDGRKWRIGHSLHKEDGTLAAEMEYQGTWLDLNERKVTAPPEEIVKVMQLMNPIPVQ